MNSDQSIIESAYQDAIKSLYSTLFGAYAAAIGDAGQMREADQRFMAGVGAARSSRDRAVALLGESAAAGGA